MLTKWIQSGPTGEVICVKRGKDAAMLAGKLAGEYSQRQIEWVLQWHKSLCLHLYLIWLRLTEIGGLYYLPGSRDKSGWLENLHARMKKIGAGD